MANLWYLLHSISYFYPQEPTEKDRYYTSKFFNFCVPNMILCSYCKSHYIDYINITPVNLINRNYLINWVIDLHNDINKRNNKKIYNKKEVNLIYENQPFNHNKFYLLLIKYTHNELTNKEFFYKYIEILKNITYVLPCYKCRNYLIFNLKNTDLNRSYLFINSKLGNNLIGKKTCFSI